VRSQRLPFGDEPPPGTSAAPAGARRAADGPEPRATAPASNRPSGAVPAGVTISGTLAADTMPPGSAPPSGDPFAAQLAELCRAHPARAKWVLVPTHAAGHTLGDRLARHGASWANLRFVTPLQVAIHMAGPFLVERGIDPSEEPLGPALVMRLLTELPATHDYFRRWPTTPPSPWPCGPRCASCASPGCARRTCGRSRPGCSRQPRSTPSSWRSSRRTSGTSPRRTSPTWLSCSRRRPGTRTSAPSSRATCGRSCPAWRGRRSCGVSSTRCPASASRHARSACPASTRRRAWRRSRPVPSACRPPPSPTPPACASCAHRSRPVCLGRRHAGPLPRRRRDAEIEEVCRHILASGRPLDQVEIVCASDAHASLAWRRLDASTGP